MLVLQSQHHKRQPTALHPVDLPGLLRSPPGLASAQVATGTPLVGLAGSLPALPVCLPLLPAGTVKGHGVVQATGEVKIAAEMAVLVASVLVVSVPGAQKPAASTATRGRPGLLAGVLSRHGQVPGLAAAPPLALPSLLPSLLLSLAVAQLKSLLAPPSVSKPSLPPPPPPPTQAALLHLSAVLVLAVRLWQLFLPPCSLCRWIHSGLHKSHI